MLLRATSVGFSWFGSLFRDADLFAGKIVVLLKIVVSVSLDHHLSQVFSPVRAPPAACRSPYAFQLLLAVHSRFFFGCDHSKEVGYHGRLLLFIPRLLFCAGIVRADFEPRVETTPEG